MTSLLSRCLQMHLPLICKRHDPVSSSKAGSHQDTACVLLVSPRQTQLPQAGRPLYQAPAMAPVGIRASAIRDCIWRAAGRLVVCLAQMVGMERLSIVVPSHAIPQFRDGVLSQCERSQALPSPQLPPHHPMMVPPHPQQLPPQLARQVHQYMACSCNHVTHTRQSRLEKLSRSAPDFASRCGLCSSAVRPVDHNQGFSLASSQTMAPIIIYLSNVVSRCCGGFQQYTGV